MAVRYVLSDYVDCAMAQAVYDKLEDASFVGTIPSCVGVIAFAPTLRECEIELRSTLEDWILLGLKLGHPLPIIDNIGLIRSRNVSRWIPIKRRDFIRRLRQIGFEGPFAGTRHDTLKRRIFNSTIANDDTRN